VRKCGCLSKPCWVGTVSGCSVGTYGSKVSAEQKAAIVKGQTTKVDLLCELGNPDQKIDLGGGKEQFSYIKEKYTSTGFTASSVSVYRDHLHNNYKIMHPLQF
jgi:hypothetical protein